MLDEGECSQQGQEGRGAHADNLPMEPSVHIGPQATGSPQTRVTAWLFCVDCFLCILPTLIY